MNPNIKLQPFGLDSKDLTELVEHEYPIWVKESWEVSVIKYEAKLTTLSINPTDGVTFEIEVELKIEIIPDYYKIAFFSKFHNKKDKKNILWEKSILGNKNFGIYLFNKELGIAISEFIKFCERTINSEEISPEKQVISVKY